MGAQVGPVTVHRRLGFTEHLLRGEIPQENSKELNKTLWKIDIYNLLV